MTVCAPDRTAVDRCPGSLLLHRAQDGYLARVRLPGGRVSSAQLVALADAAGAGNGLVELTSRANLQLRGLSAAAGPQLAGALRKAGLLPSAVHDRARNLMASPLGGRHPSAQSATDDLLRALDAQICAAPELSELSGRFLFAVDDGTGLALERRPDLALIARGEDQYGLVLAGQLSDLRLAGEEAVETMIAGARAFLAERRAQSTGAWRVSELTDGANALARRLGARICGPPSAPPVCGLDPGRLGQRDGRVSITALVPLGRLDAADLRALAEVAPEVRIGSSRTLTVVDAAPDRAGGIAAALGELGLLLEAESGWVGLTACSGQGRCPRARLDVSAASRVRAATRRPGAPAEHWTACERRCGERAEQAIAVTATEHGIELRVQGTQGRAATVDQALAALAAG